MHYPRTLGILPIAFLAIGITFTACKKDEPEPPATPADPGGGGQNVPAPSTTPNFSDADGSLWAVQSFTTQSTPIGNMDIQIGLGVGAFTDDGFNSYINAGTVSLNGVQLSSASNGTYYSQPSQTQPTGIDLSSGVSWSVSGGSGVPAFDHDVNSFPMPTLGAISANETVVRSNGYTMSTTQVAGADSVLFLVGHVAKTLSGNATTCSFTPDELSALQTGANVVQIAAYKYTDQMFGGKKIYFGKEAVRSVSVTIQ